MAKSSDTLLRRKVIALFLNDAGLGDYYQGSLRRGAEEVCAEHDIDLWVYGGRMDWSPSGVAQRNVFELVDPKRVDGVIIASGCLASFGALDDTIEYLSQHCPVSTCSVGQTCPGMPSIVIDNATGAEQLAEHMVLKHGRRHFAYIAGPVAHQESDLRLHGTRVALARHGLHLRNDALRHGNFSTPDGRDITRELLDARVNFDALIVANDDMAVGALDELRARGIACPDDVALAGFDDAAISAFTEPALTTIRQPVPQLGAWAVEHIMASWEGVKAPELTYAKTELVIRESCGCHSTAEDACIDIAFREPVDEVEFVTKLARLLVPVLDGEVQRKRWAIELHRALEAQRAGESGSISRAFRSLLSHLKQPHVPVHDLQRVVSFMRSGRPSAFSDGGLDAAFHEARVLISANIAQRASDRDFRVSWLRRELQATSERLPTSLSLAALGEAIAFQLPRLGINNCLISLYLRGSRKQLEPFVCLQQGMSLNLLNSTYPAELLMPDGFLSFPQRCSLTVMPLTFESEQLGVAVLEIPTGLDLYALLREQIGSAIKTVNLHEEILENERLHAQVQEDRRVAMERLGSMSIIAGGVAHDLNNVLGPLVSLPEAIRLSLSIAGNIPPEVSEDLEVIRDAGIRAADTIRDLLTYGQLRQSGDSTLEINRLLQREQRALFALCENRPDVELHLELSKAPLPVQISKSDLMRVISNLVTNALDATEGSGRITVRTHSRILIEPLEGTDVVAPGAHAIVEIEDTGVGVAQEYLSHIFEPFFTAKHRLDAKGTGLGLAIVHRIVRNSMGTILVRSQLGSGTCFTIVLPLQESRVIEKSSVPAEAIGGGERILVVDDEVIQLRTARRILTQLGYAVMTVRAGEEAVDHCSSLDEQQAYDLIIVDMVMPGRLNGIATVEQLRRRRPGQKVIIASGFAPCKLDDEANARGIPWLAKPYTYAGLAQAVRSALDEGRHVGNEIGV